MKEISASSRAEEYYAAKARDVRLRAASIVDETLKAQHLELAALFEARGREVVALREGAAGNGVRH